MSKDTEKQAERYVYTQNRELSWLRFNQRVLEEAGDLRNPPLERLKYIAIFSTNLDEFFMARVGSLLDRSSLCPGETDNKTGMPPAEQLERIYQAIPGLLEVKQRIYVSVASDLRRRGVCDLHFSELIPTERKFIHRYYEQNVLPIISPIIIGSHHPAPRLVNKCLCVAVLLREKTGKLSIGLVPVPETLPPYVILPDGGLRFIRMENILLQWAPTLFGTCQVAEACVISVTRNADIRFDQEKFEDSEEDFRSRVAHLLKKRDGLSAVRLEISGRVSEELAARLSAIVQVEKRQICLDSCPLNMRYVYQLAEEVSRGRDRTLLHRPYQARWPEDLARECSLIEQVCRRDKLLFYPFDSVEPFLGLLSEAAERADVLSIKITIYRLASFSRIAKILCRAAENGKQVIVLMELRARFDEANNITWSKLLENAGCQVIYGVEGFKCHSKICLITMRGKGKMSYITQIGTGNYNEETSAMYTDLSIMTASDEIGEDGTAFFQNMLVNNLEGEYRALLVSPQGIKARLLALMDREIAKGTEGYICLKVNAITQREVIDKLQEASRAGVEVQLIVRGICCLLPGVIGHTDNVHVTSIVGRYLEHARIYCFGRGEAAELYISSADLMTRNLDRRVEIACPVHDRAIREQLQWILDCQLKDNVKASAMMPDGLYRRKVSQGAVRCDSQRQFMDVSLHRDTRFLPPKPSPALRAGTIFRRLLG